MKGPLVPPERAESNLAFAKRAASIGLQIGVVGCMLALLPEGVLGIRLCNSPKELAFHFFGLTAASLCLIAARQITIDWTDLLFGAFLLLSILSGVFGATDRWEALRAVGVTLSGVAVFWSARDLASDSQRRPLLNRASLAVLLVAAGVLVDASSGGYRLSFARPGGTQGNRNWAGHLLTLGMPLLALQRPEGAGAKRNLFALFVSSAALALTRSRAAWIAALFGTALPLAVLAVIWRRSRASILIHRPVASLCALVLGGVVGVYLPTRLNWRSPHPYRETVQSLVAYNRGSGYGRIVQYQRTMAMAIDHPALGIGPGNWKIFYPAYSIRNLQVRIAAPIWQVSARPNSDWIGFTAERGAPATIVMIAALVSLAVAYSKSLAKPRRSADRDENSGYALAGFGILIALAVVGSFDAVLQLPAPNYLVFLSLGALTPRRETIASLRVSPARRAFAALMILLVAVILMVFTFDEIFAACLIARRRGDDLTVASRIAVDSRWFDNQLAWSLRGGLGCD